MHLFHCVAPVKNTQLLKRMNLSTCVLCWGQWNALHIHLVIKMAAFFLKSRQVIGPESGVRTHTCTKRTVSHIINTHTNSLSQTDMQSHISAVCQIIKRTHTQAHTQTLFHRQTCRHTDPQFVIS